MTKLLLLINKLSKSNKITLNEKGLFNLLILRKCWRGNRNITWKLFQFNSYFLNHICRYPQREGLVRRSSHLRCVYGLRTKWRRTWICWHIVTFVYSSFSSGYHSSISSLPFSRYFIPWMISHITNLFDFIEKMSYQMIEIHSGSSTKTNNQSETTSTTLTKETIPQSNKQNTLSSHAVATPYSTLIITTAPKIGYFFFFWNFKILSFVCL